MPKPLPKLWDGATCFILGGGYSLNNIDLTPIHNRRILAINNSYGDPAEVRRNGKAKYYIPRHWVDICWFGDKRWFDWHYKYLKNFPGLIVHCCVGLEKIPGLIKYGRGKPKGIDIRDGLVAWNGNSGISGINFAYHLGVKKVILLGFDMKRVSDRPNWHQDHPSPMKNPYGRYLEKIPVVIQDSKRLGLEIINCCPDSLIDGWPKMSFEEYLKTEK